MQSPLNLGVAEVINTYVYKVGLLSPDPRLFVFDRHRFVERDRGVAAADHGQSCGAQADCEQRLVKDRIDGLDDELREQYQQGQRIGYVDRILHAGQYVAFADHHYGHHPAAT